MKKKKLLSTLFATALLLFTMFSVSATATADGPIFQVSQSPLPDDQVAYVTESIPFLEDTTGQHYESYKIGNEIPAYLFDGINYERRTDLAYYPIYGDQNIVAIYTVSDNGGSTFGADFADALNNVVQNGAAEYALVGYDENLIVLEPDKATTIITRDSVLAAAEVNSQITASASVLEASEDEYSSDDVEEPYSGTEVYSNTVISGLSEQQIVENFQASISEITFNADIAVIKSSSATATQNQLNAATITDISPSLSSRATSATYHYRLVGTYQQSSNECWAAATKILGAYYTGINKSTTEICTYANNTLSSGGNIYDAQDCFSGLYDLDTTFRNRLTWTAIQNRYSSDKPFYASCNNVLGTNYLGHTVVVCGYYSDGSESIVTSDSLYDNYMRVNKTSAGYYEFYSPGSVNTYRYLHTLDFA
ncbi:MAG: hypothetical protein LBM69_00655 [Lachnospiraceae bacterium]|jgi:hypothetical protein|nr:hypothetical protein [Lachnospiraceae bacterium]